ncbi:hypothetical protein L596_007456 [Steinernema carpocapsae]|uniref:LysM domain-containing protein n=1 Tax=Steinernema carpocapsae TaxID=34508 RepID=A0A4U5P9R5_STECR|nr:hypothetical protein L596_007456 [Steinernema carpocapsae]
MRIVEKPNRVVRFNVSVAVSRRCLRGALLSAGSVVARVKSPMTAHLVHVSTLKGEVNCGFSEDCNGSPSAAVPLTKLRARGRRSNEFDRTVGPDGMTYIEHTIKPGDTLNKIAIQYHIQVSELKRVNNLVTDQDWFALPSLKVPVSRLKRQLLLESNATTSNAVDDIDIMRDFTEDDPLIDPAAPPQQSSVEAIFVKTDAAVAQVRENLPSPHLEANAFHFIDARSPDSNLRGFYILVALLIFAFVCVPLFLTYEEEVESHAKHHHHDAHATISPEASCPFTSRSSVQVLLNWVFLVSSICDD